MDNEKWNFKCYLPCSYRDIWHYISIEYLIQDFNNSEIGSSTMPQKINPINFEKELNNNKKQRKLLLTIDDGYRSFYDNAWPVLKKSKIPFILFVSTREVGKIGYMGWDEISEIEKFDLMLISIKPIFCFHF